MRKKPVSIFITASLFLYFPFQLFFQAFTHSHPIQPIEWILMVILPVVLFVGLLKTKQMSWYALIGFVFIFGLKDVWEMVKGERQPVQIWVSHLMVFITSLGYFINPRIRSLYFDPKTCWWKTKPRHETYLPFFLPTAKKHRYPIIRNLSEGGCFIETQELLSPFSEIEIHIPLPRPVSVSYLTLKGQIRWVSQTPLKTGMGVQFKGLTRLQLRIISALTIL